MPVSIGAKPQADFTEPIGLLMDCHRRIERFLAMLRRVVNDVDGGSLSREYREALQTALDYFKSAAPRHTQDEEQSLFPRMREASDEETRQMLDRLASLEADHDLADTLHARADELGRAWLSQDRLDRRGVQELAHVLAKLQAIYLEHIDIEDKLVFPLAQRVLSDAALAQVGREMAQRRAVDPGRPGSRCAQRRQREHGEAGPHAGAKDNLGGA